MSILNYCPITHEEIIQSRRYCMDISIRDWRKFHQYLSISTDTSTSFVSFYTWSCIFLYAGVFVKGSLNYALCKIQWHRKHLTMNFLIFWGNCFLVLYRYKTVCCITDSSVSYRVTVSSISWWCWIIIYRFPPLIQNLIHNWPVSSTVYGFHGSAHDSAVMLHNVCQQFFINFFYIFTCQGRDIATSSVH